MEDSSDKESKGVDRLIAIGADVAGSLTGAAIGLFAAGPVGGLAGATAGPLITHSFREIAAEIQQRLLGPREEVRMGATFTFAAARVQSNLAEGKYLRQDDFFQGDVQDRSAVEEIIEGTLLVAQREQEERKLRFYGNLLANIAFHQEVSRAQANQLLKQAERMSYRQLCLLAFYVQVDQLGVQQVGRMYDAYPEFDEASIVQEVYDLFQQGVLHRPKGSSFEAYIRSGDFPVDVSEVGLKLYHLMQLHEIAPEELTGLSQQLWAD